MHKSIKKKNAKSKDITFGEKISDKVAATVGSWRFILIQSTIIFFWILFNTTVPAEGYKLGNYVLHAFDPFPFIFLNLTLSFQAAYTAPIIMMSQNRTSLNDREKAEKDYQVNVLAEKEIETIIEHLESIQQKILIHEEIKSELVSVKEEIGKLKEDLNN